MAYCQSVLLTLNSDILDLACDTLLQKHFVCMIIQVSKDSHMLHYYIRTYLIFLIVNRLYAKMVIHLKKKE